MQKLFLTNQFIFQSLVSQLLKAITQSTLIMVFTILICVTQIFKLLQKISTLVYSKNG